MSAYKLTETSDIFVVNQTTQSNQILTSVTTLGHEKFLFTWDAQNQAGVDSSVFARAFNSTGIAATNEFQISPVGLESQSTGKVLGRLDGTFTATWSGYDATNHSFDIYQASGNALLSKVDKAKLVNTNTNFGQVQPNISGITNSSYEIYWTSQENLAMSITSSTNDLIGKQFSSSGVVLKSDFVVSTNYLDGYSSPSVARQKDGSHAIFWSSNWDVYGRIFDSKNLPASESLLINKTTYGVQVNPKSTSLDNGNYVITWTSMGQDGSMNGIFMQRLDSNGRKIGDETQVNTYTQNAQDNQAIAALPGGGFVVVWSSIGQEGFGTFGIYSQIYNANGQKDGNETALIKTINSGVSNLQVTTNDGSLCLSWNQFGNDGSELGIGAKTYSISYGNLLSDTRTIFNGQYIAKDIGGKAGQVAKILGAVFGSESTNNKEYVGIGLNLLDSGVSYNNLCKLAADVAGLTTNDKVVSTLWHNIVGTAATSIEKSPFISMLENGTSIADLVQLAADTPINSVNINLIGLTQSGLAYLPVA